MTTGSEVVVRDGAPDLYVDEDGSRRNRKAGGALPRNLVRLNGDELDAPWSLTFYVLQRRLFPGEIIRWDRRSRGLVVTRGVAGETVEEFERREVYDAELTPEAVRTAAQLANAVGREAFNRVYSRAASMQALKMLQFDAEMIERGLADDATDNDRAMANKVITRSLDRLGGKAVAPVEQVGGEGTIAGRFARSAAGK